MEHSPEEDFNPYRAYTRTNLIWELPLFIVAFWLILFLSPIPRTDISNLLGGVFLFLIFTFPLSLLVVGLILLTSCIPGYFVGYTAEKLNLKCNRKDKIKAAGLTAFYYWIFSSFILVQMISQDFSFSAFGLFSLYVAIAGALSSVIPSNILPKC
jgi:putative membrane protein